MSVGVVNNDTINAIVHAADFVGLDHFGDFQLPADRAAVGQALLDANFESYESRYGLDDSERYEYQPLWGEYTPAEMWGAIRCYLYQSSESSSWRDSYVRKWVRDLQSMMASRAVEEAWGKAPWGLGFWM